MFSAIGLESILKILRFPKDNTAQNPRRIRNNFRVFIQLEVNQPGVAAADMNLVVIQKGVQPHQRLLDPLIPFGFSDPF